MKKLVLYSAQETPEDHQVNLELQKLFGVSQPRVAWIPSDFVSGSDWFHQKVQYYARYGMLLEEPVKFDQPFDGKDLDRLFSYDAIHLSGGDTVEFLSLLRKHELLDRLQDFVNRGKILIGISAGAILMTPSIATTFEGEYGDERPHEPFDFSALGLVDFAFLPHYVADLEARCKELALEVQRPLYACKDGTGIVVNGNQVKVVGDVRVFDPSS